MQLDDLLENCFDSPESMPTIHTRIDRLPDGEKKERLKQNWDKADHAIRTGRRER